MKVFLNKIVSTIKDIDTKVEHLSNAYQESAGFFKELHGMDRLR